MKTPRITLMLAVTLALLSCSHQPKEQVSLATKTEFNASLDDSGSLQWRCPTVSFSRQNPDGTLDNWYSCAVRVGNVEVYLNSGAIIPLGELTSSEDISSKTFDSYAAGSAITSEPITYASYVKKHAPSKIAIGYEVAFSKCPEAAFTLYVRDKDADGALAALEFVFDTMKLSFVCNY